MSDAFADGSYGAFDDFAISLHPGLSGCHAHRHGSIGMLEHPAPSIRICCSFFPRHCLQCSVSLPASVSYAGYSAFSLILNNSAVMQQSPIFSRINSRTFNDRLRETNINIILSLFPSNYSEGTENQPHYFLWTQLIRTSCLLLWVLYQDTFMDWASAVTLLFIKWIFSLKSWRQ